LKLTIELVPKTCFYSNVRSEVTRTQWDIIRRQVASKAYNACEICGDNFRIECHEIWHYDDKKLIQKLVGMTALCKSCHMVKHMGYANVSGNGEKAIAHFMKINKLTRKMADKYIDKAFDIWARRSSKQWELDITHLKEYGIDTGKIKNAK
jgi:hypothetical protein